MPIIFLRNTIMQRTDNPSILNRAGLIPFYVDDKNNIQMMFMIPIENEWVESIPQISKGRIEPGEMVLLSAIREASEELGLKRSNLSRIEPIGQYSTIMFYIGQIKDPTDFDDFDSTETKATVWMTLEQYLSDGRQLHSVVVRDAVEKIEELVNVTE